jgi:cytochrome c
MRKIPMFAAFVVVLIFGAVVCVHATPLDDAKSLAEKAAVFAKANGKEKAVAEVGNPKGQFVKGDLYVTLQDTKGFALANPMSPGLVGQNHLELKDPSGKYFIKENVELVNSKGSGWVTYVWTNPATKKVQPKKAWVQKVEGTDMYMMCGVFQQKTGSEP